MAPTVDGTNTSPTQTVDNGGLEAPAFDSTTRRRTKAYILQSCEIDAVPRAPRLGTSET